MKSNRYSRLIIKRTDVPGLSATTAATADHTLLPAWKVTDIYPGEFFMNLEDERIWIRTNHGVREIPIGSFGNIQDKDALVYDMSKGFWTNAVLTTGSTSGTTFEGGGLDMMMRSVSMEGGGGVYNLSELSDTNISDPVNGQILIFNNGYWFNRSMSVSLSQLEDTTIQSPKESDILIFSKNGKWINKSLSYQLSDISNVKISNLIDGQVLAYSGDSWINKFDRTVTGLTWNKSTSTLTLESQDGAETLILEGGPIELISSDILLNKMKRTILVDATFNPVNVYVPSASECYGTIFTIKIVNDTFQVNVIPDDTEDHIFTNLFTTGVTFAASTSVGDKLTIQSNGTDVWYSI